MNAFLVLPENIQGDRLAIAGAEAHHCARVLRMRAGETIIAIDGVSVAYRSRIESLSPDRVECVIEERLPGFNEPMRAVTLGAALLKQSAKFDIVVEKAVELGVFAIVPLLTVHGERTRGKSDRWREIAASAAKQSLRCRVPTVDEPRTLADVCAEFDGRPIALAHEKSALDASFAQFSREVGSASRMLILIGPEGGFSEEECVVAERFGARRVSLGPRRLRSETAAIVSVGIALEQC